MDLKEAKKKIEITPEERKAIEKYVNYKHTQMNILASFDVLKYLELKDKGWDLLGINYNSGKQDSTSEEIGEGILQEIEELSKVYSAMYKYSKLATCPRYLYRGTSDKSARKLKAGETYDRLISTTTDLSIAKQFTKYGDDVLLTIKVNGSIPFLDVEDFLGRKNSDNRDEKEVILSPFSKIVKADYSSKDNNYTYYNIELEPPKLRPFEEGEKESFSQLIKTEFSKIIEKGKLYRNLLNEYEINFERIKRTQNREDINFLYEKNQEIYNQISDIKTHLDDFSKNMKNYVQGLCVDKQKEYYEASEVIDEENKRVIEEKKAIQEENQRINAISNYNSKVLKTTDFLSSVPETIEFYYDNIKSNSIAFSQMCVNLGIPFNSDINNLDIEMYIDRIKQNIGTIKEKNSLKPVSTDTGSIEMVNSSKESLDNVYNMMIHANAITENLNNVVQLYNHQGIEDIKKGIDFRIQELIRKAKIEQLENKRIEVLSRKKTFWGRITGKNVINELELQNIDLQLEFERTKPIIEKTEYSTHDSISDMFVFANENLNGVLTPEMQDFCQGISSIFRIDTKQIDKKIQEKMHSYPLPITNDRKTSFKEQKEKLLKSNMSFSHAIEENVLNKSRKVTDFSKYGNISNPGVFQFREDIVRIFEETRMGNDGKSRFVTAEIETLGDHNDDFYFR